MARPRNRRSKWAAVNSLRRGYPEDRVPESAFTTDEYAARYGLVRETAAGQLARMVRAGLLLTGKRRQPSGGGMRWFRFYWVPAKRA